MQYLDKFKKNNYPDDPIDLVLLPDHNNSRYGASYVIKQENLNDFYKLYSRNITLELKKKTLKRKYHFLVEKPNPSIKSFGPLNIDLDFRWDGTIKNRVASLTVELIEEIADLIKDNINNNFEIMDGFNDVHYTLMRDNGYTDKNIWKDGAHIQFPKVVMDYKDQLWLRDRI